MLFSNFLLYIIFITTIGFIFNFFFKIYNNSSIIFNNYYVFKSIYLYIYILLSLLIFLLYYIYYMFNLNIFLFFKNDFGFYFFPYIYIFIIVTIISLVFCLSYNYNEILIFFLYIIIIFFSGLGIFFSNSIFVFFLFYEFLLLPSFVILYKYAKTRRSIEASFLMFFWTQFGALFLFFFIFYLFFLTESNSFYNLNLINFTLYEVNIFFILILIGFGVKLPIWPFYEWLPKAHVEASTNFSIFLSGVLVKFAFFSFFKFLFFLELEFTCYIVFPYLIFGMFNSILKVYQQTDIKKLIAYSTVAEMHWLLITVISGYNILWLAAFSMLIAHAIISTNSFLMVDSITRRFKTRYITELSGINFLNPKLFLFILINCLIFLGFPGSLFFISEFLFFSFLIDVSPFIYILVLILVYMLLALFFFRIWMNLLFSSIYNNFKVLKLDLDLIEILIFSFLIIILFIFGQTFQLFLF